MRATIGFACALMLVAGCGDDSTAEDGGLQPDLSAPTEADLKPAPDLTSPDYTGVSCGAMTCGATQECCLMLDGTSLAQTCVAQGSCSGSDAGPAASFTCDGPEDCSGGTPCCAQLAGSFGGDADAGAGGLAGAGSASCTSCSGSLNFDTDHGTLAVSTKLCHASADCTGLSGITIPGVPLPITFDTCCSSSMIAYHFCFSSTVAALAQGAVTCP